MGKLKFLETMTINEFKSQKEVKAIEVKQNPHTGKCFFVYGCETGAVSDKFINGEITNPVISQVCSLGNSCISPTPCKGKSFKI